MSRMKKQQGASEALAELLEWVRDQHDHHRAHDAEGNDIIPECYDGEYPYVNSLELERKILAMQEDLSK